MHLLGNSCLYSACISYHVITCINNVQYVSIPPLFFPFSWCPVLPKQANNLHNVVLLCAFTFFWSIRRDSMYSSSCCCLTLLSSSRLSPKYKYIRVQESEYWLLWTSGLQVYKYLSSWIYMHSCTIVRGRMKGASKSHVQKLNLWSQGTSMYPRVHEGC